MKASLDWHASVCWPLMKGIGVIGRWGKDNEEGGEVGGGGVDEETRRQEHGHGQRSGHGR